MIPVDVEVHPLALRRYLEFFVAADVLKIRSDENLGYVPIPELIRFQGGRGIWLQVQRLVMTDIQKIQIRTRPAGTNLGAMRGLGLALRPVLREDRARLFPNG